MDPTARNDNPKIGDKIPDPSGNSHTSPIQPGQFVVAQEEPPSPAANIGSSPSGQNPKPPAGPQTQKEQQVMSPPSIPQPSSVATTSPETTAQTLATTSAPPAESTKVQTPPPPENAPSQPDPTPFVSPQQEQDTAQMGGPEQPSKIEKLKIILLIGAALVSVVIIAALVWFFVLNKKENESAKTQLPQEQVEEPQLPPKRTTGGFGELPPATPEATGSASPSPESQPTASPAP